MHVSLLSFIYMYVSPRSSWHPGYTVDRTVTMQRFAISSKITSLMENKERKQINACPVDNFVAWNVKNVLKLNRLNRSSQDK